MITLERIMDLAKANPLVPAITRMMQGALGVALFTTPCYAVAAECHRRRFAGLRDFSG